MCSRPIGNVFYKMQFFPRNRNIGIKRLSRRDAALPVQHIKLHRSRVMQFLWHPVGIRSGELLTTIDAQSLHAKQT